ncbi:LOW QUALITY PROTEIN: coiled-coil domain-containing protein 173 [Nematolebias whitei]|uniref:LOW QUALITY PROTEIN: coiled-coil domain-containing protein 173 n=1 Tax=Nematolebias whitei TaxID=451745 RepID=UPI001898CCA8|nr:LOW QUALITY PROTEIN: coiled-coil domain-containing protein 173 [Nematolebias whitei]
MASVAANGRRRGFCKSGECIQINPPPALRQFTVLKKTDWMKVQDDLRGVNKEKQRLREAAKHREALHLRSKEVVKLWSNTITSKGQKRLEAKKIREQMEEEERKQIEMEENSFKEQKRQEAIEKARTQHYYQTDRVRGLHSALLLSDVLKQREAQIELKQRMKRASEDVNKTYLEVVKTKEEEASKQEQEKALQRKLQRLAAAEDLKNQIQQKEFAREQVKLANKKDGEDIQRLSELHQWEQKLESERQAEQKKNLMQAHLVGPITKDDHACAALSHHALNCRCFVFLQDHIDNRAQIKMQDAEKREAEEEQRKLFVSTKQKMTKLRKEREQELFREAQLHRETILNKLSVTQQEQTATEEQRIAKAVAEQEAKRTQLRQEERKKKSEMLKSIAAHRELMRKEKEHRDQITKKETQDALQAKREADRIFLEKKQQKAEKLREEEIKQQAYNAAQVAEKSARLQRLKEEHKFEAKTAQLIAEEENRFQQYSQQIINAAVEAKKNVFPLYKAARKGTGGGCSLLGEGWPIYLVHDSTGAQMPKCVTATTEKIKKLHQPADIQEAKARLGFLW